RVWYPEGCCEIERILAAFRDCHRDSLLYSLEAHPLTDHQMVRIGEVEVLARRVEHWHSIRGRLLSPAPALGYRITFRGETVAISGDTAPCPALVDLVRDADLALIEATLGEDAPLDQRTHLHLTTKAARDLARLAHRAWFIHTPRPSAVDHFHAKA
ncbi:MAG: MBL fold metallo-hydrolase, partial [Candidatus Bipolaricaulota bacterium]